jgi:hypothetical protein
MTRDICRSPAELESYPGEAATNLGQGSGGHREARNTQTGEDQRQQRIRGSLTAHPDWLACVGCCRGHHLDQAKQRRLPRIVERGKARGVSIGREGVLSEVVGTNADEVDLRQDLGL